MATLLLIIIYSAFMSLGVPHSLIGAAWPQVCIDLGLGESQLSIITFIISGCTVIASLFGAKLLSKIGTAKTAAYSTALTAVVMLLYIFSKNYLFMCILAVPLGLGAGVIDAGLNNYIAVNYKPHHMNFLHCFYGIGAAVSPVFISFSLKAGGWKSGYFYAFLFQGIISAALFLSFPLWKKDETGNETETENTKADSSLKKLVCSSKVRAAWVFMMTTNIIEYSCGTWLCTYFVNYRHFTAADGALMISLFYIGMAAGRFVSGVTSGLVNTWKRIFICIAVTLAAIAVMFFEVPRIAVIIAVFMIGFGNGPIYPNFIYLIPYNFSKEESQSIMGSIIASAYTGVMLTPVIFGTVSRFFGMDKFMYFLFGVFVLMAVYTFAFVRRSGKPLPKN